MSSEDLSFSEKDPKHFATEQPLIDPPPSYSDVNPSLSKQQFIFRHSGDRFKAFPSEKSMSIYEEAKKQSSKSSSQFVRAKEYQNKSIGLPLIVAEQRNTRAIGKLVYLRLFHCNVTPGESNKVYDKRDDRQIGEVHLKKFMGYYRYIIQLKDVEVLIIFHLRLGVADFQIGNERFRFVKSLYKSEGFPRNASFFYKIYLLNPDQTSLLDNMNSSLEVSKSNPLLGTRMQNFLGRVPSQAERVTYTSPYDYGTFEGYPSGGLFSKNKKCAALQLHTRESENPDANDAVDFKSFIFVTVSLVLSTHEDYMQQIRSTEQRPL